MPLQTSMAVWEKEAIHNYSHTDILKRMKNLKTRELKKDKKGAINTCTNHTV
jgi:hypothetical protein